MQQHGKKIIQRNFPWADPLSFLSSLSQAPEESWVLLYSGLKTSFTGRYSFLALREDNSVTGQDFSVFEPHLQHDTHPWLDGWFGYLGYGLKNSLEHLREDQPSAVFPLPHLWMIQYRLILVFDHEKNQLTAWARTEADFNSLPEIKDTTPASVNVTSLASNMTAVEYRQKVDRIKKAILAGDLYQANLTRKFFGTLTPGFSPVEIFKQLCKASPAPYSALLKLKEYYILSSSPEQFLHLAASGEVVTRPIKGTARRHPDKAHDAIIRHALLSSEKNQAENLMIVDLMRNDLARSCKAGTVKVQSLFDLGSYATVHHLSSTICGLKQQDISPITLIKGCFPPGSMTGAPKIKAMELCSLLEEQARGVYSGCIGWFGGDGSADLSVVIRTLLITDNRFEFQVGGAIIADSNPEEEWQETLSKAAAIAKVLGITLERLADI